MWMREGKRPFLPDIEDVGSEDKPRHKHTQPPMEGQLIREPRKEDLLVEGRDALCGQIESYE